MRKKNKKIFSEEDILAIIDERNKRAKEFKKGSRVIVSSSSVEGHGTVTYKRYLYSFVGFPIIYVKMDDGRKIKVPIFAIDHE
jgi:hypothetical protein